MSIDFEIALIIKARKLLKITVIPMILFYITHLKMTEYNWGNGTCFELIAHNNMVLIRNLTRPVIRAIRMKNNFASYIVPVLRCLKQQQVIILLAVTIDIVNRYSLSCYEYLLILSNIFIHCWLFKNEWNIQTVYPRKSHSVNYFLSA